MIQIAFLLIFGVPFLVIIIGIVISELLGPRETKKYIDIMKKNNAWNEVYKFVNERNHKREISGDQAEAERQGFVLYLNEKYNMHISDSQLDIFTSMIYDEISKMKHQNKYEAFKKNIISKSKYPITREQVISNFIEKKEYVVTLKGESLKLTTG